MTHRSPRPSRGAIWLAGALLAVSFAPNNANGETPEIGRDAGQMHPDFLLPNLDGGSGRLSDYRGKKVLLFHFASW